MFEGIYTCASQLKYEEQGKSGWIEGMFGDTKNAWKLSEEDLPASSRLSNITETAYTAKPSHVQPAWLIFPLMLLLALIWFVGQHYLLDLGYTVTFNSESLPNALSNKPLIVPAPVRYNLLQPALSQDPIQPALVHLNKLETPFPNPITPANYTPSSIPTELVKPAGTIPTPSVLPVPPSFKLVGIAQGRDGMVATLKIQDDSSGIKDQLQDVREGSSILNGYTVSRITPDYVLVQKTGKMIRVE